MLPLKSQFKDFVQFTENIEDRILNFHINDAFVYTIKPLMGVLADDIKSYDADIETKPELKAFFDDYVLRWWVLLAYQRFLQNHGRNVTQFGYTQLRDPQGTFEPVDAQGRAVYLKQLINDTNVSQTLVFNETWTFDDVSYRKPGTETDCGNVARKSFGISSIE